MAKREYQTTKINHLTIIGEERATYKEQRNNQRPRKKKTWVIVNPRIYKMSTKTAFIQQKESD